MIWLVETWLLSVNWCHSYFWHYFLCLRDSYCILYNYLLRKFLIPPRQYMCFCYHFSGQNNNLFTNPYYLRKHLTELSCDITSYVLNFLLNHKQRSRIFRYWYFLGYLTLEVVSLFMLNIVCLLVNTELLWFLWTVTMSLIVVWWSRV